MTAAQKPFQAERKSLAKWIDTHPRKSMRDYMLKCINTWNSKETTSEKDKVNLEEEMFGWEYDRFIGYANNCIQNEYRLRAKQLVKQFSAMRKGGNRNYNKVVITGEKGYACVLHFSNMTSMAGRGGHYNKPEQVFVDCMFEYMCMNKDSTCEVDELKFQLMDYENAAKVTGLPVNPNTISTFNSSFYDEYEQYCKRRNP